VIPRLVDAWYPNAHHDELPARRPGELSYFVPESMWRADDRGQEASLAYDRGLTALLYVHRVVINSPLLILSSVSIRGKPLEWRRDLLFTALHLLSSLKDLIDVGVAVIVGSDANYWNAEISRALIDRVDQREFGELDYISRHSIEFSLTSGCAIDIFCEQRWRVS
jgi:hypothetical protein